MAAGQQALINKGGRMIGWGIIAILTALIVKSTVYSSDKGVRTLSCFIMSGVAGYALMKGISVIPSAVVCFSGLGLTLLNMFEKEKEQ